MSDSPLDFATSHSRSPFDGCVERLQYGIQLAPWVFVPLSAGFLSLSSLLFGPFALFALPVFAIIGATTGFYLSMIVAAILEWMIMILLTDRWNSALGRPRAMPQSNVSDS